MILGDLQDKNSDATLKGYCNFFRDFFLLSDSTFREYLKII